MKSLYLLSVWLHILAAIVWIGGMAFLAAVLVPGLRRPESKSYSADLLHWSGHRFRRIGWACLGLLIVTGVYNVAYRGFGWSDVVSGSIWDGPFGRTLAIKLVLVGIVHGLSLVHDFIIGPQATQALRAEPDAPRARRLRRRASWFGRIEMLLALVIVFFGVMLVRGGF